MLRHLPAPLRGVIAAFLYVLSAVLWPLPIFVIALLRFLIPVQSWRKICTRLIDQIPVYWMATNNFITDITTKIEWDVRGLENLKSSDWYLLISNHRSWTDILVLGHVLNGKIPPLKFFMKRELLWGIPFIGWAAWIVGYPILHRHTKEYLAKHPEQKGKDMITTRIACEKFKYKPTSVINFAEGTRFTAEKHARQSSPYRYLLRPKSGGIAYSLYAMGEYFNKILDVTIIYPNEKMNLWDYLCGRIKKIRVNIEALPLTEDILGDYENDRNFRVQFQTWMNELWKKKDQFISENMDTNENKTT